jgi:hypothetical protein
MNQMTVHTEQVEGKNPSSNQRETCEQSRYAPFHLGLHRFREQGVDAWQVQYTQLIIQGVRLLRTQLARVVPVERVGLARSSKSAARMCTTVGSVAQLPLPRPCKCSPRTQRRRRHTTLARRARHSSLAVSLRREFCYVLIVHVSPVCGAGFIVLPQFAPAGCVIVRPAGKSSPLAPTPTLFRMLTFPAGLRSGPHGCWCRATSAASETETGRPGGTGTAWERRRARGIATRMRPHGR